MTQVYEYVGSRILTFSKSHIELSECLFFYGQLILENEHIAENVGVAVTKPVRF